VLAGEIDVGRLHERDHVEVRPSRARLLLGMDLAAADIREALGRLRLQAHERDEDAVVVEVPGYRVDLEREADVIEEVGRMRGYDTLPSTLPGVRQAGGLTRDQRLRRKVVDVLVGAGLAEAVSSSFVPRSDLELFEDDRRTGIRVANPVSEDEGFLRTSLLPGLLRAARRAVANRRRSVRLFEVGAAFVAREHQADERWRLGVVLHGPAAEGWPGEDREQDYLDAKGVLEHLLASLGIERWSLGELSFAPFHPGRSTEVAVPGEPPLGEVAELHPSVAERFDLPGRVAVLELELAPLLAAVPERMDYAEVSRFPAIHRDLAYVVSADVPAGAVLTALREAGGELLDRALLFDVYEGDPLPAGSRSLAFSVDFRAPDRTLTDQEADAVVEAITRRLGEAFDAHLRTG
jgi:phenylalanyl-tRNA synthetase beta chain